MSTTSGGRQKIGVNFLDSAIQSETSKELVNAIAERPISAVLQDVDRLSVWTPAGENDGVPAALDPGDEDCKEPSRFDLVSAAGQWWPPAERGDTAPAVERFSTARYRPEDWIRFNHQTLARARDLQRDVVLSETEARRCLSSAATRSEVDQRTSTRLLSARAHDIHGAQSEVARAAWLCREEEDLLEQQRLRLRRAIAALTRPRAITMECLERRHDRLEHDLVQDQPELQLGKELALLDEVSAALEEAVRSAELQLSTSRAARERLEHDWGGKVVAGHLEASCLAVTTARPETAMLRPACTRLPDGQSLPLHWESFTRDNLAAAAQEPEASQRMREEIEQLVTAAARAMRTQADAVESALERRIIEVEESLQTLEEQLSQVLTRTSETERLISDLRTAIANHGVPLRVAHTRLDTRLARPGVESCRDAPQAGLVNEVRRVEETLSSLRMRLTETQTHLAELQRTRTNLEHRIRVRKHSLFVDRTRCRELRLAFPSTVHLTGY